MWHRGLAQWCWLGKRSRSTCRRNIPQQYIDLLHKSRVFHSGASTSFLQDNAHGYK
jgi:hypothetical protein